MTNVSKRFGKIDAISNLNLEIRNGEYICILGPTGSGKSTLLKLIAGTISPDEGQIYIDGRLANRVPPQERETAYFPQQYALFPNLNVLENAAFSPISKGFNRERAYETAKQMLEVTKLAWRADSFPNELSGGMQQRLALARALASGANLLLLDEPLGALDARLRVELRYKLREIAKERGLTTIHVTHDQEEAMMIAERIIILRNGKTQQEGTPMSIYENPSNIFVAHFVGGANFLEGFIAEKDEHGSWFQLRNGFVVRIKETRYPLGERIVLMIREEMTKVTKRVKRREKINLFPGSIQTTSFLGGSLVYEILLDNGDTISSKVPTSMNQKSLPSGTKVYVYLDPEFTKVYPYPSAGLLRELEVI